MTPDRTTQGDDGENVWPIIHDALNRMKRAHDRGTGCHLTPDMIRALGLSMLAEAWSEPDPRLATLNTTGGSDDR
jgi:hypothetical protein